MRVVEKKICVFVLAAVLLLGSFLPGLGTAQVSTARVKLGNEVLLSSRMALVKGKRVGLVTNQTGVSSEGKHLVDVFAAHPEINLVALYAPEHGIDGKAKAGAYVPSTTHPTLGIPIYSLYGPTRKPTSQMLAEVDVLVFDMQDIGSRTYTYMSTMNYAMVAAKENYKPIVILDRPNPVGGVIVDGPVLEDKYISFVGIDNLPMAHGMTAGELALFFNRKIGANVTVVPMEGYYRDMVWQDTGLTFVQTSPNIPDIESAFGYMATGLGEGIPTYYMGDKFKWVGGGSMDHVRFAQLLNGAGLPGVVFVPEKLNSVNGVRLNVTNYRTFNPAKTGFYALAYAKQLTNFSVPKSGSTIVMFEKIMGTDKVDQWLEQGLSPQQMEANWQPALNAFKKERQKYLIYRTAAEAGVVRVRVGGAPVVFDAAPYIDSADRTMVPLRAIGEALGSDVHWDATGRTVTMKREEKTIVLTIGSRDLLVDGQERSMDTVAVIKNSRTMVPVRFVSEFLGAQVHWDNLTRTVSVN
jgi:uncharacterized protein YbbC (DUF1343 family)